MTSLFTVEYSEDARALAAQFFGRNLTDEDLACAVGALDGAKVIVRKKKGADELRIEIQHPQIQDQQRWVRRTPQGELVIFNYRFYKKRGAPSGLAVTSLLRQIEAARALGVTRLETFAAGNFLSAQESDGEIGYWLWAKLGFDTPLSAYYQQLAMETPSLVGAKTLNEIILRPGGEEWWYSVGAGTKMIFELSSHSSMMRVLRTYLRQKGKQR